jgi:hypothetical protein
MTTVDLIVIGAIAVVALYPAIKEGYKKLTGRITPTLDLEQDDSAWRQQWVATLIDLQSELEQKDNADQVILCRQLIWQMLGGEPSKK